MIFSVSNNGFEWSIDFGPDSVTLNVKDLVHEMTMRSKGNPLASKSLLLSQGQEFLKHHPAQFLVTPKQEGTVDMKDEVLSSVRAQNMDTSGYHVSNLEGIAFHWEDPD